MSADKKGFDPQELMEALQNLDFENVGGWPKPIKAGAAVLVFVLVVFLSYMLIISENQTMLATFEAREAELMQEYEQKAFKAQNLEQYRQQLTDMQDLFGSLLDQLPKETEVPGLLEDITHTGLGSGLEFEKIDLGTESEKEFYAELPIQVTVMGDYHGFGSFVGGVAALPRIVTLGDFSIRPINEDTGLLEMQIVAKTYRYASGDSKPASKAPAARKGGRAK